ncbi:hypothetical protein IT575_15555 [bacterium]|nr:hypothetical protein [bacterium]
MADDKGQAVQPVREGGFRFKTDFFIPEGMSIDYADGALFQSINSQVFLTLFASDPASLQEAIQRGDGSVRAFAVARYVMPMEAFIELHRVVNKHMEDLNSAKKAAQVGQK